MKIPEITVHGRFQPPIHINHWGYVGEGFERADRVHILITNPFGDETFEASAGWRDRPESNPFSYQERIDMFTRFFTAKGISDERYDFRPFNIQDEQAFRELDPQVPNLVNIYSEWSAKKAAMFQTYGLAVVQLELPEPNPVSGTIIRGIISENLGRPELPDLLVKAGFLAEAVPGLMETLAARDD